MAAPVMVIGLSALIILALGVAAQSASSVTVTLNSTAPSREVQIPGTGNDTFAITLNICAGPSIPVVRVSTASPPDYTIDRSTADRSSGGSLVSPNRVSRDQPTWDLSWDLGYANWTGEADSLGILVSLDDVGGSAVVRIDLGSSFPERLDSPVYGDSTADAVLLFSPLLESVPHDQPSYPNYTLPRAQLPLAPTTPSDLRLILVPTTDSPTGDGLDNSLCAVQRANNASGLSGQVLIETTQWTTVAGEEGYRGIWAIGDLTPRTNYTAWVVDGNGGMSSPIWFATKEADFPCQLAMPNPLCPGISYTAPLSPNTTESPLNITQHYPITTLPEDIATVITNSLEAFSTSILAQPCGRDLFSHTSTCADCFAAYRDWLCRALVPQCASTAPRDTVLSDQAAEEADDVDTYPQPQTIARQPGNSTNGFGAAAYGYTELLPCLSVCNAVDRQCPVNLHFRCPRRGTTANETYAFIGQKHSQGDGSAESRFPAGDKWGNRWCNG